MKMDRRVFMYGVAGTAAFAITGRANATETLRLAHASSEPSLIHQAMLRFQDAVKTNSGGSVEIQIFPNGQLGDEGPTCEAVGDGSIDIGVGGVVDSIDSRLNAIDLPFLYNDFNSVHKVLDGEVGNRIRSMSEARGYKMLGTLDSGFRNFTNNKRPINVPDDLKGLKLRCPPIPVVLSTVKALGGLPQAIPFGEVYSALQSGVVDGAEPEMRDFYDQKWYEVQKYLSIVNYIWLPNYWYMNKARFDGLTAEQRAAVDKSAHDAEAWFRGEIVTVYDKLVEDLKAKGIVVNNADPAPFRAKVGPVYDEFSKEYGEDLVSLIRKSADAANKG